MDCYETLMAEYDYLDICEQKMKKHEGLYGDDTIWINKDIPTTTRKTAILAEEIGHHENNVGDITDQTKIENQKEEYKARKWASNKLIPDEAIKDAITRGYREVYEIADYLGVDEEFLRECLERYHTV